MLVPAKRAHHQCRATWSLRTEHCAANSAGMIPLRCTSQCRHRRSNAVPLGYNLGTSGEIQLRLFDEALRQLEGQNCARTKLVGWFLKIDRAATAEC
eukprot:6206763-Pleurochrysis_carterae.AAC.11